MICVKNFTTDPPRELDFLMGYWSYDILIFAYYAQVRLKKNGEEVPQEGTDGSASSSPLINAMPLCSKHMGGRLGARGCFNFKYHCYLTAQQYQKSPKKWGQVSVVY